MGILFGFFYCFLARGVGCGLISFQGGSVVRLPMLLTNLVEDRLGEKKNETLSREEDCMINVWVILCCG